MKDLKYPVVIFKLGENEYFAFLPDFGHSACSAVGNTAEEAMSELNLVKQSIIKHYIDTKRVLPKVSKYPFIKEMIEKIVNTEKIILKDFN